jgi:hypothetical protein
MAKMRFSRFWRRFRQFRVWLSGYDTTFIFFQITSVKNSLNSCTNPFLTWLWKVSMCEHSGFGVDWPKQCDFGCCWSWLRVFLANLCVGSVCMVTKKHWATFSGPRRTCPVSFISIEDVLPIGTFQTNVSRASGPHVDPRPKLRSSVAVAGQCEPLQRWDDWRTDHSTPKYILWG